MKNLKHYTIALLTACTIAFSTTTTYAHGFQLFEPSIILRCIRGWCANTKKKAGECLTAFQNRATLFRKNFFNHMIYGHLLFDDNKKHLISSDPNLHDLDPLSNSLIYQGTYSKEEQAEIWKETIAARDIMRQRHLPMQNDLNT